MSNVDMANLTRAVKSKIRNTLTKTRNGISISLSQARISQLARSGRPILLKPQPPKGGGGKVSHYYHFIFDLIFPLYCLGEKRLGSTRFCLEDLGPLTNKFLEIFPMNVELISPLDDRTDLFEAKLVGMNPCNIFISKHSLGAFREFMCNRYSVDPSIETNRILLIERLPADQYYVNRGGGGAARRSILNHQEVYNALKSLVKPPYKLQNLQLENMTIREQLHCFDQAAVVIGQHGAGLTNCTWMRSGQSVVELSTSTNLYNYRVLCERLQLDYHWYKTNGYQATINVEDFIRWLSLEASLRPYFLV